MAAFSLGYQQSANASKNNLNLIQSYAVMEKAVIDNYEKELDMVTLKGSVNPKLVRKISNLWEGDERRNFYYYDNNGLLVSIN
jgi:predicted HNH restriction endonuclease